MEKTIAFVLAGLFLLLKAFMVMILLGVLATIMANPALALGFEPVVIIVTIATMLQST